MARLNLERAIKEGLKIINERYDLSYCQTIELMAGSDLDKVHNSFCLGYFQGYKAAKAELKKSV